MAKKLNLEQFGPWALVTGASSGIGEEFARQLAASGLNLVLIARRGALLENLAADLSARFGVQCRPVVSDVSVDGFLEPLATATDDLDIGLVVSNAGTGNPGRFLDLELDQLMNIARLNALSQVQIAHHFGRKLKQRGRGGLLMAGAMGAAGGIAYMANESGTKAYVQSFGLALHEELKKSGVNVTVLIIPPTQTAIIDKFGLDPAAMPMKPMQPKQCVEEALQALIRNRVTVLPGRINRIMMGLIPQNTQRKMMSAMMGKALKLA